MQDRRHAPRFSWKRPVEGTLYVLDDVVVERYVEGELLVLASMAAKPDEMLTLERLAAGDGRVNVRVVESSPAFMDGQLRHRLRLRLRRAMPDGSQNRVVAGLVRSVLVRVLDVSVGGCQLESGTSVENGGYAELEVPLADEVMTERLRVCRCRLLHGAGSIFRMGAQFTVADRAGGLFRRAALHEVAQPPEGLVDVRS